MDFRIGEVEIDLPVGSITRHLPLAGDGLAVVADPPDEALIEVRRLPPHFPDSTGEARLVDAPLVARVVVENRAFVARRVAADQQGAVREHVALFARLEAEKLAVLGGPDRSAPAALRVLLALHHPFADEWVQLLQSFVQLPAFIFSSSSLSRSIDSLAPSSIPEATMPSRSITDSKTWWVRSLVLLPTASKVAVSSATWPGTPSYSKVLQIRSGVATSWFTPRNACRPPSAATWTTRHEPPGRESNLSILTSYWRGPHHCTNSSGSV